MLFIQAAKVLSISILFLPLAGACIGTGYIFGSLIRAAAYAPDTEDSLFNYAVLGFAFIESFIFMMFGGVFLVYGF